MNEIQFIRQNKDVWDNVERLCLEPGVYEPDELATAYQQLTTDLAFAQTHFPDAPVAAYLNDLAMALHAQVYRRHPARWQQVLHFLAYDVPQEFYDHRLALLASLIVFLVGTTLGIVSQITDAEYAREVLGDYYVNMTLENIDNGTPVAVYGTGSRLDSFFEITLNNVGVAFRCYVGGLLTIFGAGLMLIYNGLMLGSFQTFFFQHGVGPESMLAIWLHGTIEISSIIVAGGAGIVLGTGWLYPGTYKRSEAFMRSARQSLRIVTGTVPLFVVAGFIEGFFTRHTEWPDGLRLAIILASFVFMVWYVIIWPRRLQQPGEHYGWWKRQYLKWRAKRMRRHAAAVKSNA